MVEVDVEYCGTCGYFKKYEELSEYVLKHNPEINLKGHEGRRASFEVMVNGILVHSKLSTLAYPDYDDLLKIVEEVTEGKEVRPCKGQPINNKLYCHLNALPVSGISVTI